MPALRVCEYDPEYATAALARLIKQGGAIGSRQFARQKKPEAGSALRACEKRLEYAFCIRRGDTGSPVRDLEIRAPYAAQAAVAQENTSVTADRQRMRHRVL